MSENVYVKLQEKFDSSPMGFPKTESGIELKILRSLYNEEEAEMALNLSILPTNAQTIAEKTGGDPEGTEAILEEMAHKGLVYRRKKDGENRYSLLPYLPGIWELQVKNITPEFNEMMAEYYDSGLGREVLSGSDTNYFKVVPNKKNITAQMEIFNYEEVSNIVNEADKIAVFDCICRLEKNMQGTGCDKPLEVCMAFGNNAEYLMDEDIAREVTKEEAIRILDQAEEAGLVHSSTNTSSGHLFICNCCCCCCTILRGITHLNLPTAIAKSNFYAQSDADLCTACGVCEERCQVSAISMDDDVAQVTVEKCIGCGLCVSTCPTEAMAMVRKPEAEIKEPPARIVNLLATIAEEKGKTLS